MSFKNKTCYDEMVGAISRIWLAVRQKATRQLVAIDYDLTFEQLIILHILDEHEGLNLGALAEQADRERTTISRMVDGLEKKNLVVRVPDQVDRRQKLLYLTNLGRERLVQLETIGDEFFKKMYAGMNKQEVEETLALLRRVQANLDEI